MKKKQLYTYKTNRDLNQSPKVKLAIGKKKHRFFHPYYHAPLAHSNFMLELNLFFHRKGIFAKYVDYVTALQKKDIALNDCNKLK